MIQKKVDEKNVEINKMFEVLSTKLIIEILQKFWQKSSVIR